MARDPASTAAITRGTSSSSSELAFFDGFRWPLPLAFAAAVAANRFEQGDVLFRDRAAYAPLEGVAALAQGGSEGGAARWAIQVLDPPRSARAAPADAEGDRRRQGWQSEVTVELVDLVQAERQVRTLSQGKLVMALWQGDESWLEPERPEPPMPLSARELQARLEQTRASFDTAAASGCRFLFVVDLASDASREKARLVEEALRASGAVERMLRSPVLAGVEDAEQFHPALEVRCLRMPDRTLDQVQPVLRACLYAGAGAGSDPDAGEAAPADRFSVARHGLLEALGD